MVLLLNFNIALGPLLFCYVKALTEKQYRWTRWDSLHFLPTFSLMFYTAAVAVSANEIDLASKWWTGDSDFQYTRMGEILLMASSLYFFTYVAFAARRLSMHKQNIEEYFSNVDGKQLNWLWLVIGLCTLIAFTTFVAQAVRYYSGFSLGPRQVYASILTTILIYFMAFMGMRQNFIFAPKLQDGDSLLDNTVLPLMNDDEKIIPVDSMESIEKKSKYEKSGLKEEELGPLWEQLQLLMLEKKPFLDSDLKLADLAEMMGLSANYLSQVINRGGEQKFFDYINAHRVQEAVELLKQKPNVSLLHIALDAGFISQQAFSSRFKKVMALTPSQYRKKLKN